MCPSGAHLPNRVMAWSTGVTYSLARNSCLTTSMRLECAICGRGAEFPQASARRCLTFPHCVYSAHRFSSRSFSSPTRCTGFWQPPGWRQAAKVTALSWGTADPPRFASWSVWPDFPTVLGWTTLDFVELCNISSYILQGQVLCKRVHPRTVSFQRKVAPENFWHFIEIWNEFFITEPTTSTQARTRIARMGVGTLNQSTSRDGYSITLFLYNFI